MNDKRVSVLQEAAMNIQSPISLHAEESEFSGSLSILFRCFFILLISFLILPLSLTQQVNAAPSVLVFQPSGGLNDGTDVGGETSGKDAGVVIGNGNNGSGGVHHHFNSNCNNIFAHSFHQWDVSGLPEASAVTQVNAVFHMRVRRNFQPYQINPTTMTLRTPTAAWDEMAITWANQPSLDAGTVASVDVPTPQNGTWDGSAYVHFVGEVTFDITQLYKDWKNAVKPNYGVDLSRLQAFCENTNETFVYTSDSTDPALRPRLEITGDFPSGPDTTIASLTPYKTAWFTNFREISDNAFYQDHAGKLHLVAVSNYELVYYSSTDHGVTWSAEPVSTPHNGDIHSAVITADSSGKVFIAYTTHSLFNYANPSAVSGSYTFIFDIHVVENSSGAWLVENVASHTSNFGPTVSAIYEDAAGNINLIANYNGWWSYGGTLWEYTRSGSSWSPATTIVSFSDTTVNRFIDSGTFRLLQNSAGDVHLILSRSNNDGSRKLFRLEKPGATNVWSAPTVIADPVSYGYIFDASMDASGNINTVYAVQSATNQYNIMYSENFAAPTQILSVDVSTPANNVLRQLKLFDNGSLQQLVIATADGLLLSTRSSGNWSAPTSIAAGNIILSETALNNFGDEPALVYLHRDLAANASDVNPFGPDTLKFINLGSSAAGACVSPPSDMVHWWDGDAVAGTAVSDIQGSNDGVLFNGATTVPGKVGNAFSFDGVDDYIRINSPYSIPRGQDFTVDLWVNKPVSSAPPSSIPSLSTQYFLFNNRASSKWGNELDIMYDGRVRSGGRCNNSDNTFSVMSTTKVVNDGQWHHVVVVYDWASNTNSLYINGVLEDTNSLAACNGFTLSNDFTLGALGAIPPTRPLPSYLFDGMIDEFEIFNRALSQSEIQAIYNAGSAGKCKSVANQPPVPTASDIVTNEDTAGTTTVYPHDPNLSDTHTYVVTSLPPYGSAAVDGSGGVIYTPNLNLNGTDSFAVTVTDDGGLSGEVTIGVTINAINDAPTATSASIITIEDTGSAGVTPNVSDVDMATNGDSHSFAVVAPPAHGSASVAANQLIYTPSANFYGSDAFIYRATDSGGLFVDGTANVTVTAVNDAPSPMDDSFATLEDTAVVLDVLANDSDVDGDMLTITAVGPVANGTVVNNGASLTYKPNTNFNGGELFTYTVSDGHGGSKSAVAFVKVLPVNDVPQLFLTGSAEVFHEGGTIYTDAGATASDIEDGDISGSISMTGSVDVMVVGTYTLTYKVMDSGGLAAENVMRTVNVVDSTPPALSIPGDVTAEANGTLSTVVIGTATASDVFGAIVSNNAPSLFPIGTTEVIWTAVDGNGLVSSGIQNVTVQDNTPPVLVLPADVTVEAEGVLTSVDIGTATATDIFGATVSDDAPAQFPLGTTEVTWTATDEHGLSANGIQRVTVTDTTPPVVSVGGELAFMPASLVSDGGRVTSVTSADFNGDGMADLAMVNYDSSAFKIYLGDGSGGFTPGVSIGTAANPTYIDSGDFNNDGKIDVVVASAAADAVYTWLGDGAGNFTSAGANPVPLDPMFAVPFDFNNDGNLDLLAGANNGGWRLYVLQGAGNGTFTNVSSFGGERNPRHPAIADFNGDGYVDVLVPTAISNVATLFTNNSGTGSFSNAGVKTSATRMEGAVSGDFNADGFADVAISIAPSNKVRVMLGDGAGNFSGATDYATEAWPNILRTADMNGDGIVDIVAAAGGGAGAGISVLLGHGDGTFQPALNAATATFAGSVTLADFNQDGRLDAATSYQGTFGVGGAYVLLNGTSSDITVEATGPTTPVAIGPATAFDLVDGPLTPVADQSGPFNLGAHSILWSATDSHSNTGTASQLVTVVDTTPPVISAPASITVEAAGPFTPIALPPLDAFDLVDGPLSALPMLSGPFSGGMFMVGSWMVPYVVEDSSHNMATVQQSVIVVDSTPPAFLSSPDDITMEATAPLTSIAMGPTQAFDAVDGPLAAFPDVTGPFPVGTTLVTYSVTDHAGNTASVQQHITITDTTAPVIAGPADVTLEATGVFTDVQLPVHVNAFDIVDGNNLSPVQADDRGPFSVGPHTVTWSVTDTAGNTATFEQQVTVVDTTAPQLTLPDNVSVEASGAYNTVAIGMATAVDLVDGPVAVSSDAPATFPVGTTLVVWTAADAHGNSTSGTQTVTVTDSTAPAVTAPADVSVEATGPFTDVALGSGSAVDLVDGPLPATPDQTGPFAVGTYNVIWSATDTAGNTGSATQAVNVNDTTPPVLTIPADMTVEANAVQSVVDFGMALAVDLVDGPVAVSHNAPATFPLGTTQVTWLASDAQGNSVTGIQHVTVLDNTPPLLTLPGDVMMEATGALTTVDIGTATASDIFGVTITSDAPAAFPVGTTTVTWTATDGNHLSTSGTQSITVTDSTAPAVAAPADITLEATGPTTDVELGSASATDLVDGVLSATADQSGPFGVGVHSIIWTATDLAGNTGSATQKVTVTDHTAPVLTAPADVLAEANGVTSTLEIGTATAFDLVDGEISVSSDAPAGFPLGETLVTYTVTDSSGNTATATQMATVSDTTAPVLHVPGDVTAEANAVLSTVEIGMATATDIFDVTITSDTPAVYPLGSTTVTWMATDTNGNAISGQQNVTVADTTAPVLTVPADVSVEANGVLSTVDLGLASATDIFGATVSNDAPATFALGTTTVTYTATDGNGLTTTGTQTVTVADTTAPVLNVPVDVDVEANGVLSTVEIGTATATDTFDVTVTNNAPETYPLGLTVVTWTAIDANGNSTSATQNVTVSDTTAPAFTFVPEDVSAEANGALSTVEIGMATATDIFEVTVSNNAPTTYPLGVTVVKWSATDANGNTMSVTQNVTVVDTTAPELTLPTDVTAEANGVLSTVEIGTATATDIFEVTITSDAPATYPLGLTVVTWTALDANGNSSSGTQNVMVQDSTAPVLSVPADVTEEATGVLTPVSIGNATATDIFEVTITNDAPATYPLGTTVVTWTATDANGNVTTGTQNVTVVDTTAPSVTAELVPLGKGHKGKDDEHEDQAKKGLFKVVFSATDIADPSPVLTATLNGVTVSNGQIVTLKNGKKAKSEIEHGRLEIQGLSFTLDVSATDASGNTGTASDAYAFPSHKDDDHGIHRGNDKEDKHADSGNHKSEGKAKVEKKDSKKSDSKSSDKKSDSKKDKKRS